jgi:hypothetical protein
VELRTAFRRYRAFFDQFTKNLSGNSRAFA